ncbi:MAG TPA: polysaccharide biosynthesis C-terminal domain-containing protein [Kofleriaceae bacterium]|jgi:O-antigen/teichoic acid export membrane protein
MDTRLRRDVAWNLVPIALLAGVGLGLNFAIAVWWGPEALATFALVTTAMFALAVVGAFGLQYAVLRAIAEAPDDRPRVGAVVVGALIPNVVLAALATVGFIVARGAIARLHGSHDVGEGMLWAAPGLFCFAINKVLFGVVNGLRRMRAFALYTALRYILIVVGLAVARVERLGAAQLPVIWSLAEGALLLVLVAELAATVSLRERTGWLQWSKAHLAYGARGVTATLAFEINSKLDVWMLGASGIAKSLVGAYSLAASLNEGASQVGVVVQNNLNPMMARGLASGDPASVSALARRTRKWFVPSFVACCAAGALLFPHVIPALVADPRFAVAAAPFAVLMVGAALGSPYLPFTQVLLMGNRPGWHTVLVVATVTVNLVANLVLIPSYGIAGAAIATSLAVVASCVLVRTLARRCVGARL